MTEDHQVKKKQHSAKNAEEGTLWGIEKLLNTAENEALFFKKKVINQSYNLPFFNRQRSSSF